MKKERIDTLLVIKGLVETRTKAQALIMSGRVFYDSNYSRRVNKAGEKVAQETEFFIKETLPFVGRGGVKLKAALDEFNISVENKIVLDVGASTGGFTDCVLQRGAKYVYALDVGHGQIDHKLRIDNRVKVIEKCNFRNCDLSIFDKPIEFVVVDVSFISLELILPNVYKVLLNNSDAVVLIKPQFECNPGSTIKGIIKDENLRKEAVKKVINSAEQTGFSIVAKIESPIHGDKGNIEYLMHIRKEEKK